MISTASLSKAQADICLSKVALRREMPRSSSGGSASLSSFCSSRSTKVSKSRAKHSEGPLPPCRLSAALSFQPAHEALTKGQCPIMPKKIHVLALAGFDWRFFELVAIRAPISMSCSKTTQRRSPGIAITRVESICTFFSFCGFGLDR